MSKNTFFKLWRYLTAIAIVTIAIALIICCVAIYRSGDRPFQPDTIAYYAKLLLIPGLLCLCLVIGSLWIAPESKRIKASIDQEALLKRYQEVLPLAKKEQNLRLTIRIGSTIGCVLLMIYPAIYLLDKSHFSVNDINGDVLRATLVFFIPATVCIFIGFLCRMIIQKSISREIEIHKNNGEKPGRPLAKETTNPKILLAVRIGLLLIAVIFIVLGIDNGGIADVLGKAIRICTECIGLG